jgi:hypothetical protein
MTEFDEVEKDALPAGVKRGTLCGEWRKIEKAS